jgi:hypothetical protein
VAEVDDAEPVAFGVGQHDCCGLTRRFIEAPMQRLGGRAAGRLDARFGPDVLGSRRRQRGRRLLEPAGELVSRP